MVLVDEEVDMFYYYRIVDNYYYVMVEVSLIELTVVFVVVCMSALFSFLQSLCDQYSYVMRHVTVICPFSSYHVPRVHLLCDMCSFICPVFSCYVPYIFSYLPCFQLLCAIYLFLMRPLLFSFTVCNFLTRPIPFRCHLNSS